jgi:hypothetical protein
MHGLPMNGQQWRKVVPLLPDYRCIRPTMPLGVISRLTNLAGQYT